MSSISDTAECVRNCPDQRIVFRHPLADLPSGLPLREFAASASHFLVVKRVHAGKVIDTPGYYIDRWNLKGKLGSQLNKAFVRPSTACDSRLQRQARRGLAVFFDA